MRVGEREKRRRPLRNRRFVRIYRFVRFVRFVQNCCFAERQNKGIVRQVKAFVAEDKGVPHRNRALVVAGVRGEEKQPGRNLRSDAESFMVGSRAPRVPKG